MTQLAEEQVGLLPPRGKNKEKHYIESAPVLIKYRSSKWFILGTICLALFTDSFIYGVVVPVLPFVLRQRCHIEPGTEQLWTSAMFALFGGAILIGSPICGYYADRTTSRRLPLLLSLPILAGATALFGLSSDVSVLLISRFLQGLSTAVVWTVGLSLTKDTVAKDEVGQCMGTAISSNSVGLVISPTLGGIVYEHAGLWGVLGMMIGLVVLNIILVVLMIEKRVAKTYRTYPKIKTGYGTDEYLSGSSEDGDTRTEVSSYDTLEDDANNDEEFDYIRPHEQHPYADALGRLSSITTITSLRTITSQIRKPKEGWLQKFPALRLFRSRRILTDAYGVFTQFGILASFDAFLPLFVERRFAWSSLGAGLIFLTIALPALLGPVAGKLSDRFGPRRVAFVGCLLTAPPLVLLRVVEQEHNTKENVGPVVLLCVLLVLIGVFLTLIISPLAADMSFAVDKIERDHPGAFGTNGAYGQAYAFFNVAMAAACVAGPLVAGAIQDRYGAPTVAWVLAVWVLSAAMPVIFFTGTDVKVERAPGDDDEDDD